MGRDTTNFSEFVMRVYAAVYCTISHPDKEKGGYLNDLERNLPTSITAEDFKDIENILSNIDYMYRPDITDNWRIGFERFSQYRYKILYIVELLSRCASHSQMLSLNAEFTRWFKRTIPLDYNMTDPWRESGRRERSRILNARIEKERTRNAI